jgi:formate hydrogenlyase transcriptional activator
MIMQKHYHTYGKNTFEKKEHDLPSVDSTTVLAYSTLLFEFNARISHAKSIQELSDIIEYFTKYLFEQSYFTLIVKPKDFPLETTLLSNIEVLSLEVKSELTRNHDGFLSVYSARPAVILLETNEIAASKALPYFVQQLIQLKVNLTIGIKIIDNLGIEGVLYIHLKKQPAFMATLFDLLVIMANQIAVSVTYLFALKLIRQQREALENFRLPSIDIPHFNKSDSQNLPINLVGDSAEINMVRSLIQQVAFTDSTVLLLGETGTGKGLIAKMIHTHSRREKQEMIHINCAVLPANLIESELFGHEKGSFTGANQRRIGKFEQANGGTVFLDEIGELPLALQAKLLRVLEEKEIHRIGGQNPIKITVRIITATNRNLVQEVKEGRFRADLYYRLNVFPIFIPPLRTRMQDIPLLTNHFIETLSQRLAKPIKGIANKAIQQLMEHNWYGNIRELENLIEKTILLTDGTTINHIVFSEKAQTVDITNECIIQPLAQVEYDYIIKALKHCKGRIFGLNGAALKLKLPPTTLISKMQKLGIRKDFFIVNE